MVENANNTSVFGIEGVPHFFLVNTAEAENENLKKCETVSSLNSASPDIRLTIRFLAH